MEDTGLSCAFGRKAIAHKTILAGHSNADMPVGTNGLCGAGLYNCNSHTWIGFRLTVWSASVAHKWHLNLIQFSQLCNPREKIFIYIDG
jgi:hypothetical protein